MEDTYLTLSTISEGLYKEKGSKFLAFAIPVSSVSEIKSILEEKVEYLNRKLKVHEQMYDYMNDSTIVMVYEG